MRRQTIQFVKTVDDVRLAYAIFGSGPIMVKTANWLNHLEFDWESPVWKHIFGFLTDHFTLIRYDERGCGLSDWNLKETNFEMWVEDLRAVVDANELQRFPLLGISQGAAVAIKFASRYPQRVSHLILVGGFARGRAKRDLQQAKLLSVLLDVVSSGWDAQNPAFRRLFSSLYMPDGNSEHQEWLAELCRRTANAENAYKILEITGNIDVSGRRAELKVPTLVVHALGDAVVPVEAGRQLAAEIPHARFLQLESANHLLLKDEPAWQQICDEILHFMSLSPHRSTTIEPKQFSQLTEKEQSILGLLAEGLSNNAIAEKAFLSEKTIRNHLSNIYSKLGVSSRAEAIVMMRRGKSSAP